MSRQNKSTLRERFTWACLFMNVLIVPGLGTLFSGRDREGLFQLSLSAIGLLTILFVQNNVLAFLFLLIAMVWAIKSSVADILLARSTR
jgi:preprotein translocase subunit SecG